MFPTLSPTSWLILQELAPDPKRSVHLRGLAKLTGRSPRPVQVSVAELNQSKMIHAEHQGNKKFFRINPNHPLYHSIKRIMVDFRELPTRQQEHLVEVFAGSPSAAGRLPSGHRPVGTAAVPGSRQSIQHHLELAHEQLGIARRLVDSPRGTIHHCYHALHYAMNAALISRNLTAQTAGATLKKFVLNFLAPGRLPKDYHEHLTLHHTLYHNPDHPDHRKLTTKRAQQHLDKTVEFVMAIHEVVNSNP